MGFACVGRRGQSSGATAPRLGGHDLHDPRRPCGCRKLRPRSSREVLVGVEGATEAVVRRMSRRAVRAGSVIGRRSWCSGRALAMPVRCQKLDVDS
jgi:hypothetical protein